MNAFVTAAQFWIEKPADESAPAEIGFTRASVPRISFSEAIYLLPFGDTITTEQLPEQPGDGLVRVTWRRDVLLINLIDAIDRCDEGNEDCGIWKNAPELVALGYPLHFRSVPGGPAYFVLTVPESENMECMP